jgi:hypothetical protein
VQELEINVGSVQDVFRANSLIRIAFEELTYKPLGHSVAPNHFAENGPERFGALKSLPVPSDGFACGFQESCLAILFRLIT